MIEAVHTDDEPESNGNDADGTRNHTTQLPISLCRILRRSHFISLSLSRKRDQLGLIERPIQIMPQGL